jgi:hypothetical protein
MSTYVTSSLCRPPTYMGEPEMVELHSFLNSSPDGDKWQVWPPGRFIPRNKTQVPNEKEAG